MEEYNISKEYVILNKTDSLGTQTKYHKGEFWYKQDRVGYEGLAESLVSDMLSCSNIIDFVKYERCVINKKNGCKSKSFLKENEQMITFSHLYKNTNFGDLSNAIYSISDVDGRLAFLINFIKDVAKIDCTDYLYRNFTLDMIIRNPDRHFKNLSLIVDGNGRYRSAPIFDNGQGLMQNFVLTPPYLSLEEKEETVNAATISGSFEAQYNAIKKIYKGPELTINYDKFNDILCKKYPEKSIAKEYLEYSLERYKPIFSKEISEIFICDTNLDESNTVLPSEFSDKKKYQNCE